MRCKGGMMNETKMYDNLYESNPREKEHMWRIIESFRC